MELTFSQQSNAFLYSLLAGLGLGAVFGIFSLICLLARGSKKLTFALDVLFMLLSSLVVFYFSMGYLEGYIRLYIPLGMLCGFAVYRLTLGKLLRLFVVPFILFCKNMLLKTLNYFKKIAKMLLKNIRKVVYNDNRNIQKVKKS